MFSDSQNAIHLSRNQMFQERTKHIDVRRHFIIDVVKSGEIVLEKIATAENPADMATKVLPLTKFRHCMNLVQLVEG